MQYWINQDGVQAGPMTLDEMKNMSLTAEAYVWREGLDDWVKIEQLSELAGHIDIQSVPQAEPVPPMPEPQPESTGPAGEPTTEGEPTTQEIPVEPIAQGVPVEPVVQGMPEVPVAYAQSAVYPPQAYAQPATAEPARPQCPPTNMVWAILATVLCCIPTGIVAIVYANKVNSRYQAGDYEGAQRASETGAWWCIGSIIAGIVASPFVSLIQMLAAA